VALADPAGHAYPAVQSLVHAVVRAVPDAHLPAAQSTQAPRPAVAYLPGPHVCTMSVVEPAGHAYPAVHISAHAPLAG
jgi:hypothetical protein